MPLERHLDSHGHVHRFVVAENLAGWDVCEEEDSTILRQAHREDWHRVERDMQLFELKALALKRAGWIES